MTTVATLVRPQGPRAKGENLTSVTRRRIGRQIQLRSAKYDEPNKRQRGNFGIFDVSECVRGMFFKKKNPTCYVRISLENKNFDKKSANKTRIMFLALV